VPGKERLEMKEELTKDCLLSSHWQSSALYILSPRTSIDQDGETRKANSNSILCSSSTGSALVRKVIGSVYRSANCIRPSLRRKYFPHFTVLGGIACLQGILMHGFHNPLEVFYTIK